MSEEQLQRIERKLDQVLAAINSTQSISRDTAVGAAPDHELDSDWANFVVDKMPKTWKGEDFAGSRLSETSAAFCKAIAALNTWKGNKEKAEGKTYVNKKGETVKSCDYSFKKAAWAAGWSARLARGYQSSESRAAQTEVVPDDDAGIPF